jgi:hypothetical protein
MTVFKCIFVAWLILGIIAFISAIGKERKPIDPQTAIMVLIINLTLIAGLLFNW